MAKKIDKNLLVALDIGTTKIVVLIGEVTDDQRMEIVGVGMQPSRGLKRGVVVNIESTVKSIARALEEAELMAGCEVAAAYTGIAGSHISSVNSHGIVAIRDKEVRQLDIDRVIDAARALAIPADQKILHILPQEFVIDSQDGVREPIGMSGVRLEAKVHIVTGAVSAAQNIIKSVKRCGLQVSDIILEQLASSHAVLTEDEKELGVCLVDIGGGTTDIAIFTEGAIRHTAVIPIAGDQVTNDIAVALRTPTQHAEQIKVQHGSLSAPAAGNSTHIEVPSVAHRAPRQLSRKQLTQVVRARYEELFTLIAAELRRSGFEHLIASGVVLTGGASRMHGALELADSIFQLPVRLGNPQGISGLTDALQGPAYATAVGLLLNAHKQNQHHSNHRSAFRLDHGQNLLMRMRNWFQGQF